MSNPLPKLIACCVLFSASTAAPAAFLKMGITPATAFTPGTKLTVIGQAANIGNGGVHPIELRLQVGRTDGNWNFIAPKFTSTMITNFGPPNAANWSPANFPAFPAPPNNPLHRMKMVETVLMWMPIGAPDGPGEYRPLPGAGNQATALFQYKCLPVNPVMCRWQRQ